MTSRAARHGAVRPSFPQARHNVSKPVDCYVTGLEEAVDEVGAARSRKHGAIRLCDVCGIVDHVTKPVDVEIYRSVGYDADTYSVAV